MSFPLETYSIAIKIMELLQLNVGFSAEPKKEKYGGYPDSKLMALLIIACKLGFNLEKTVAWREWATATEEEREIDKGLEYEDIKEGDILEISDEKLDEYMDWVQPRLIEDPDDIGTEIFRHC
jgi:RNA polymerase I-specific transcription initiation factor RRN7